jgi:hypothetical protein
MPSDIDFAIPESKKLELGLEASFWANDLTL